MMTSYARYPSLADRVVIVTGGASGIGASMVSASAQTTGSGAATNGKAAAPSTRDSASSSQTSKASKIDDLTRSDRAFMTKAAQGGLAEVELGRIAAQRATDPQVKQFAQRMVDDHGKANDKLKQVATSKNLTLPTDPPSNAKREED